MLCTFISVLSVSSSHARHTVVESVSLNTHTHARALGLLYIGLQSTDPRQQLRGRREKGKGRIS